MNSYFSQKTVVVTGAAGFLGSHLSDALLKRGARVIGIDNFITGRPRNIKHLEGNADFQLIRADVCADPSEYIPADCTPDCVLHLASPASPPRYQAHPIETYLVNSMGTHQLLQYLLRTAPEARFLYASTSEVYGNPEVHPQVESYWGNVNPNGVRSCYDEGKRLGETICGVHQRDFAMDVRMVRIFNTYGPRINPIDGRVIPQFVSQSLAGETLTIYGDGNQTRSYCYVSDLVEAILLLAEHPNASGKTLNIGNPDQYTILQTAEIIHEIINPGTEFKVAYFPMPGDDPTRRQPDISAAQNFLGWSPQVSFAEGLAKTVEYFRSERSD